MIEGADHDVGANGENPVAQDGAEVKEEGNLEEDAEAPVENGDGEVGVNDQVDAASAKFSKKASNVTDKKSVKSHQSLEKKPSNVTDKKSQLVKESEKGSRYD